MARKGYSRYRDMPVRELNRMTPLTQNVCRRAGLDFILCKMCKTVRLLPKGQRVCKSCLKSGVNQLQVAILASAQAAAASR